MFMQSPVLQKGYGFTGYQAISAGVEGTIKYRELYSLTFYQCGNNRFGTFCSGGN